LWLARNAWAHAPLGYLDRGSFSRTLLPSRRLPAAMPFRTSFYASFAMPRFYARTLEQKTRQIFCQNTHLDQR
jgi:hypothetical protein